MIELITIRNKVQARLSALLGTYSLPNGQTEPAITVRATGEPMPERWSVQGLECIILEDPDALTSSPVYEGGLVEATWLIYLVQWDSDVPNMVAAVRELLSAFPGTTATRVAVPQNIGPLAQYTLRISEGALAVLS